MGRGDVRIRLIGGPSDGQTYVGPMVSAVRMVEYRPVAPEIPIRTGASQVEYPEYPIATYSVEPIYNARGEVRSWVGIFVEPSVEQSKVER